MNVFKGFALFALVLVLSACGTSVTEAPTTVELEVQAITSIPDNEVVTDVTILNSDGEVVDSKDDFVDRFQIFQLPPGEYTVRIFVTMEHGYITSWKDVNLFSDTLIKVDATNRTRISVYEASAEMVEATFSFPWSISTGGNKAGFREAKIHVWGNFLFSDVSTALETEIAEEKDGTVVHLTRPEDVARVFDYTITTVDVARVPHDCGSIGAVSANWEGNTVRVNEFMFFNVPCKG